MKARPFVIWFAVIGAVAGCGDDGGSGQADAPPGTPDAPAIDAAPPDGPSGAVCGGKSGFNCVPTQYCDYPENGCGFADDTGFCVDRPTTCPDLLVAVPTCACDGTVYGSECDVYLAGSDLNAYGGCPVPPDDFACGWLQCDRLTQYCKHTDAGDPGGSDVYECMPTPPCASQFPNCACLADETCGDSCSGDYATGLTLTCFAI